MELPAIEGGKPVREKPLEAWPRFTEEEKRLVLEVLESGRLSSLVGSKVREFERRFAGYIGVKYAVATMNGTTALHAAVAALGIGPGDEVITTAFSFVASATAILHHNAVPVFADIDLETLNIDPRSVEERITDRTRAILVVHLAGHPAEMDEIMRIAREHGLYVIEDCAQAIGSEYKGVKVGGIGDVAAFSFYQTKNITTGEGGMVTTNSREVYERARLAIHHGEVARYLHEVLGWNYRMTEMQAALGIGQLMRVEELNRRRAEIAKIYTEEFEDVDALIVPRPKPYVKHTWHIYQLLLRLEKLKVDRDFFVKALRAENVLALVAYPRAIYENPLFQNLAGYGRGCPWTCPFYGRKVEYRKGLCPNAEYAARRVVTLPTFPWLGDDEVMDIVKAVKKLAVYYSKS